MGTGSDSGVGHPNDECLRDMWRASDGECRCGAHAVKVTAVTRLDHCERTRQHQRGVSDGVAADCGLSVYVFAHTALMMKSLCHALTAV